MDYGDHSLAAGPNARTLGPMCRHGMPRSFNADVFIDFRPMYSLSIADELKTSTLSWRRFRQTPGPDQRHAHDATVHQACDDGVGGNLHISNPGLNGLHNASILEYRESSAFDLMKSFWQKTSMTQQLPPLFQLRDSTRGI